eukprot:TRINITY_DN693_c0_g1_i2.p1 TRINITY_DN693_c0_g1~~TRINITY_DN693_c0_g1_i2.p1  ORF type:complete len:120 (+),score=21.40 TRINITY_DN693_c0_g1_i2:585-944(+)
MNSKTSFIVEELDDEYESVPSIDISSWIQENLNPDDYIVVKMDIECAEYRVLVHLFETGIIGYIDKIYVEFHKKKKKGRKDCYPDQDQVNALIGSMFRCGVTPIAWPFHQDFLDLPRLF